MSSLVLCYITDRSQLKSVPLEAVIRGTLRAGVDMVQIREKDLPTRELAALVEEALSAAREFPSGAEAPYDPTVHHFVRRSRENVPGLRESPRLPVILSEAKDLRSSPFAHACVLVNDRLDVALAAGAGGVHLGGQSMPVSAVRQVAPRPFVVGVSCHSLAEAIAAESAGADYLLLGPVFETPSKLQYGPPLGLDELRKVTGQIRTPVLALGGISVERVRPCLEAGAAGIAGIRIFQECKSIEALVCELRAQGK
jgi:thiamine-phosphate pyrophosphorylase